MNRLYVWGNNMDNMLTTVKNGNNSSEEQESQTLNWPTEVPLIYNNTEYEAVSVRCGPTYTLALGKLPQVDVGLQDN